MDKEALKRAAEEMIKEAVEVYAKEKAEKLGEEVDTSEIPSEIKTITKSIRGRLRYLIDSGKISTLSGIAKGIANQAFAVTTVNIKRLKENTSIEPVDPFAIHEVERYFSMKYSRLKEEKIRQEMERENASQKINEHIDTIKLLLNSLETKENREKIALIKALLGIDDEEAIETLTKIKPAENPSLYKECLQKMETLKAENERLKKELADQTDSISRDPHFSELFSRYAVPKMVEDVKQSNMFLAMEFDIGGVRDINNAFGETFADNALYRPIIAELQGVNISLGDTSFAPFAKMVRKGGDEIMTFVPIPPDIAQKILEEKAENNGVSLTEDHLRASLIRAGGEAMKKAKRKALEMLDEIPDSRTDEINRRLTDIHASWDQICILDKNGEKIENIREKKKAAKELLSRIFGFYMTFDFFPIDDSSRNLSIADFLKKFMCPLEDSIATEKKQAGGMGVCFGKCFSELKKHCPEASLFFYIQTKKDLPRDIISKGNIKKLATDNEGNHIYLFLSTGEGEPVFNHFISRNQEGSLVLKPTYKDILHGTLKSSMSNGPSAR